jgi:predicted nuclease of restriction endonuclease-like (RecB) superfamily
MGGKMIKTLGKKRQVPSSSASSLSNEELLNDIQALIFEARSAVAATINVGLSLMYWRVGKRIQQEILQGERAEYGKEILPALSAKLIRDYGRGWSERNLAYMVRFAEVFSDPGILQTLCAKLSWTHFKTIVYIDDPLKRDFYAEMCRIENWSTRTLQKKIESMLYERTALSRKSEELARAELDAVRKQDLMTPDLVFRDPYVLDFLGLQDSYSEKELESAILREIESFLLELGAGFSFIARQKRVTVDGEDFYLDLLFFHRDLKRLVAIELKLGRFRPDHFGQMALYLRWLDKYERKPGEGSPLGIILCSGKDDERVELLELGQVGIHVAEYLTELPPKEVLQRKLHAAIEQSRFRLENREDD